MGLQTPGILSSQIPPGEDHVMRRIADLERWARETLPSVARSFAPVITRLDSTDVDLIAKQAALDAQQATLTAQQATLTANVASINDLLTKVVKPQAVAFSATNFALDTTMTTKASTTITVPSGFTGAIVSVVSRVLAVNHATSGADSFRSQPVISTFSGSPLWTPTVPGFGSWGVDVAPFSAVLSGLTAGGTFVIAVKVQTSGYVWPSDTFNTAEMSGSILWLR